MGSTLTMDEVIGVYKMAQVTQNPEISQNLNLPTNFSGNSYYDFCKKYSIYENNLFASNMNK